MLADNSNEISSIISGDVKYQLNINIAPMKADMIYTTAKASHFTKNGSLKWIIKPKIDGHYSLFINRGSYMSAHVLFNLLNKLGKRYKM